MEGGAPLEAGGEVWGWGGFCGWRGVAEERGAVQVEEVPLFLPPCARSRRRRPPAIGFPSFLHAAALGEFFFLGGSYGG